MTDKSIPRILVVDDEPDIITISRVMLQSAGFAVLTADNGLDAVKSVFTEMPDCVILDVMMPRMNGYQVCRLLKHDQRTRDIPIILCTVKSLEMDRLYGMTAGANYYLTKPFDPQDLIQLVHEALRKRASGKPRHKPLAVGEASTDAILTEINLILDQKLREYTILQHVSRSIAGTLDLHDLLAIVLRAITTDLGYSGGFFLLIDEQGGLEARLSTEERIEGGKLRESLGDLWGLQKILDTSRPKVSSYRELEGVVPEEIRKIMNSITVTVVPVIAKGKVQGAIYVETGNDGCDDEMLGFFMTLAGQAGLAIDNARLYAKSLTLSITDGLTDLFNHRYFLERLDTEFTRAKRYNRNLALLFIDIDHFKIYNDTFGHLKGDAALQQLGDILKTNVREVDVVARYGGEEFVIALPETDLDHAVRSAERIRQAVADAWAKSGELTVSIGVAVIKSEMNSLEELIFQADEALYAAKREGRNRVSPS